MVLILIRKNKCEKLKLKKMTNKRTIKNLKNHNAYSNRFKETIRNSKDLPDIERTQDYEGPCYASYGVMRLYIFERALKLRDHREVYLRDFGLKESDISGKTIINLEHYVVEQKNDQVIDHFIKSELKINQKNWQEMKKIHLAQAKHLEKDLKIKFLSRGGGEGHSFRPQRQRTLSGELPLSFQRNYTKRLGS